MKHEAAVKLGCLGLALIASSVATVLPPLALNRRMVDVIAVIDITQSMNVIDLELDGEPLSRLEFAKRALARAIVRLPCGSKLGLGIFTEYRTLLLFTPVEICMNRRELIDDVQNINGQMAWAGDSQIAKGLFAGLRTAKALPGSPALVFMTDGHEAPPINAQHRLELGLAPGSAKGMLIGVGGPFPMPIPKFDPAGHAVGFWQATDVLQTDLYTQGRQGNSSNESMVETEPAAPVPPALVTIPGNEHLSYLHEAYLELLASENRLAYERLTKADDLAGFLQDRSLMQIGVVATDLRWIAGLVALIALTAMHVIPAATRR